MPHGFFTFARQSFVRGVAIPAALAAGAAAAQDANGNLSADEILFAANPDLTVHPTRILVKFVEGAPAQARADALAMVGGVSEMQYSLVPGLEAINTTVGVEAAILMLEGLPFIEFVEPDHVVHTTVNPNDTYFGLQWGLHNIGQNILGVNGVVDADLDGPEGWDINTGSVNVVIAVIDTGTNYAHVDLSPNIWTNSDEIAGNGIDDDGNGYVDDIRGWDCLSNDNDPNDGDGHGTHTAGTIGARGNNGLGVSGVMWTCQLMPLRFLGPGGGLISDAIEALQYAVNNGARISNNSWGSYGFSWSMSSAITSAQSAGHLFVAAAGNDNNNNNSFPFYPASYGQSNVIAVAATTNRDLRASFSNYGSTSVDLGAPGESVASTWPGNQYVYLSGTSMASPHVAGVAGLVWAKNPTWTYTQVRDRILTTVRPIGALSGITVTGGVVNAAAALAPINQLPPRPGQPTCTNLGGGQVRISWVDNYNDEIRFQLQRQQWVNNIWTNQTMVANNIPPNTTEYIDTPGTGQWRYRVRVRNLVGFSPWSLWRFINVP